MIKSFYYQFVNFIQEMSTVWFVTIWAILFICVLVLITRFFKTYDGTQKKFEKVGLMVLALILFVVLIYLTYLRK